MVIWNRRTRSAAGKEVYREIGSRLLGYRLLGTPQEPNP